MARNAARENHGAVQISVDPSLVLIDPNLALPKKRSLTIAGHRTSITLEDAFWRELKAAAAGIGVSVTALVSAIDASREPQASPQRSGYSCSRDGSLPTYKKNSKRSLNDFSGKTAVTGAKVRAASKLLSSWPGQYVICVRERNGPDFCPFYRRPLQVVAKLGG